MDVLLNHTNIQSPENPPNLSCKQTLTCCITWFFGWLTPRSPPGALAVQPANTPETHRRMDRVIPLEKIKHPNLQSGIVDIQRTAKGTIIPVCKGNAIPALNSKLFRNIKTKAKTKFYGR